MTLDPRHSKRRDEEILGQDTLSGDLGGVDVGSGLMGGILDPDALALEIDRALAVPGDEDYGNDLLDS